MAWKNTFVTTLTVASILAIFVFDPISQDLNYHNFADKRDFFGIANFLDVASNIPFLIVGIMGLRSFIWKTQNFYEQSYGWAYRWAWIILFSSVLLVAFGSSYYHLNPNNATLVWDRLPMAIGFMAILSIVINDYINSRLGSLLLIPLCLLGVLSVIYWAYTDDLRIYAWVQFVSILLILLIISIYKADNLKTKYIVFAFVFYALSKIAEYFDSIIFTYTEHIISGHSVKHLLAGICTYCFYLLSKNRKT